MVTLSVMVVFQTTIKRIDVLRSCYLTGSFLFFYKFIQMLPFYVPQSFLTRQHKLYQLPQFLMQNIKIYRDHNLLLLLIIKKTLDRIGVIYAESDPKCA